MKAAPAADELQRVDDRGFPVEEIVVPIDYSILQHFSSHLYGSPNKAVEELVANGFDAFAERVFVYLPGSHTDFLMVWDDGDSMDVDDLKKLWWIARSPKTGDRVETRGTAKRALIGKFGIGKLASYAVGNRITHLCRRQGRFLRVSMDYRAVPKIDPDAPPPKEGITHKSTVYELTEQEARDYVESLFRDGAQAIDDVWSSESWTLAVVDEMRAGVTLTVGMLRWVLGNGMPSRPDFRVWLNDIEVKPNVEKGAFASWDLSTPEIRDQLTADWKDAAGRQEVDGEIKFRKVDGETEAVFPMLGPVRVRVQLFDRSLKEGRPADIGRSYGFFIMVRGRLLNTADDKVMLGEPSYGTFYRSQFVIEADALDEELLADREHLRRHSPAVRELAVLQDALYRPARKEQERRDEEAIAPAGLVGLLPVHSREHYRDPLTALLLRRGVELPVDLTRGEIDVSALGEAEPLSVLDQETGIITVNESHPLMAALREKIGEGRKARKAMEAFQLVAVADRLLEGHLYDLGLDDETIDKVTAWREGALRTMAWEYAQAGEEIARIAREKSYAGDRPFEKALANVFRQMGFEVEHDGASGQKDVLVVAPTGEEEFRFTVEAKGSKNAVTNHTADVGAAISHLEKVKGATLAVIVAREFVGLSPGATTARPELLNECDGVGGRAAAVTLDVLLDLAEVMNRFIYPLRTAYDVLAPVEMPYDKQVRVEELRNPTEGFDYKQVLEEIWDRQKGTAAGEMVSIAEIRQHRPEWKAMGEQMFKQRLVALETLSEGLLRIRTGPEMVCIVQSPDKVLERIHAGLEDAKQAEDS
jgi:hypothetical protein